MNLMCQSRRVFLRLQGHSGNPAGSTGDLLVQLLRLQDLHLDLGHGGSAAPGGLSLRSPLWDVCSADCLLTTMMVTMLIGCHRGCFAQSHANNVALR